MYQVKRNMYQVERNMYQVERNMYQVKRSMYQVERNMYQVKRNMYQVKRNMYQVERNLNCEKKVCINSVQSSLKYHTLWVNIGLRRKIIAFDRYESYFYLLRL